MISKSELEKMARLSSLHLYQQEKEYLLKLFLFYYYAKFDDAIFKEGTMLRFVHGLHRFSEDLDFQIKNPSVFKNQVHEVMKAFSQIGIIYTFKREELFEDSYTCEIICKGPCFSGKSQTQNKFRIDAGYREKMIKKPVFQLIKSEYPETKNAFLVQCMTLEEVLCEKIMAVFTRSKGRDLYDIWFLHNLGVLFDTKILLKKKKDFTFNFENIVQKQQYEKDISFLVKTVIPYEQAFAVLRELMEKFKK